ncbi:hypothetical protein AVEN_109630-1 [Araneus ventricosus]|uniref:Uncharacterized protein n=1 Tax=Araneus ventricosus TaxID=182803 RepID=A0A4Y2FTS9_ARAVE|nr:hypothetical protein AVEN_109630-1 [Araneus ventricosus]
MRSNNALINSFIQRQTFLLVPLKPRIFGRKRHELDSPNLDGHLPHHPSPCYNLPLKLSCGWQGSLDPLLRLSPKRSQNITFPQKKPSASDRPSPLLRGNLETARDRRARADPINRDHRQQLMVAGSDSSGSSCTALCRGSDRGATQPVGEFLLASFQPNNRRNSTPESNTTDCVLMGHCDVLLLIPVQIFAALIS